MPNKQYYEDDEFTLDFSDVIYVLKKNFAVIRNITLGFTVVAALVAFVVPRTYESVSLIRIKQPKGISSSLLDSLPIGSVMANQQLISTYQEILKSRSVVVPVIEKFAEKDSEGKLPDYEKYVRNNIATSPFKDTELVTVAVRGDSPENAQAKNQMLLDNFLKRLTDIDREQFKTTRSFLEERVESAKKDLAAAEDAINIFQKENKILAPDSEVKIAADKLAMADRLKAENEVRLATGKARAGANSNALKESSVSMADNSVIKNFNSQLTRLEAQRVEYAAKYTEKHPLMVRINKDIAELKVKLDEAIVQVANGTVASDNPVYNGLLAEKFKGEAEANIASSNLDALKKVEISYKEDIEKLSDNQRKYLSLLRDVNVTQEIYVMLAKRMEESKVAEAAITRDVSIVDSPTLPDKHISPKRGIIIILSFLAALFTTSIFVVMRELLNKKVKSSEDVDKYLGLPVLGQIPSVESINEAKELADMSTTRKIWRALWKK